MGIFGRSLMHGWRKERPVERKKRERASWKVTGSMERDISTGERGTVRPHVSSREQTASMKAFESRIKRLRMR